MLPVVILLFALGCTGSPASPGDAGMLDAPLTFDAAADAVPCPSWAPGCERCGVLPADAGYIGPYPVCPPFGYYCWDKCPVRRPECERLCMAGGCWYCPDNGNQWTFLSSYNHDYCAGGGCPKDAREPDPDAL